jgi:hypothetical protein
MSSTPSKKTYFKWDKSSPADDFLQLTMPGGGVVGWIDGAGLLSGSLNSGGGGSGTPGGSNTQIQFNDNGVFGADSELTWDPVTHQAFAGLPSSSFTSPVQNALLTAATITATAKHTALDSANAKAAAVFATQNEKDSPGYGLGMVVTATGISNGDISGQESDVIAAPAMGKTIGLAQSLYAYAEVTALVL